MQKRALSHKITEIAVIAALYFVCTVLFHPISFGMFQLRFSELLILLCFYKKDYCWALIIGCAAANLFSPFGIYDVIFGTFATALTVFCVSRAHRLLPASLFATLFCIIIGIELYLLTNVSFLFCTLSVMAGEFIVVTVIGCPLFRILEKNVIFKRICIEKSKHQDFTT